MYAIHNEIFKKISVGLPNEHKKKHEFRMNKASCFHSYYEYFEICINPQLLFTPNKPSRHVGAPQGD